MSKNSRARRADLIRSMEGLGAWSSAPVVEGKNAEPPRIPTGFWSTMPANDRAAMVIVAAIWIGLVVAYNFWG